MLVNCAQDSKQTSKSRKPRLRPARRRELVFWPDIEGMCGSGWVFQIAWRFQTHIGDETIDWLGA